MKKSFILILLFGLGVYALGQDKDTVQTNELLKRVAENACKCIDSINTYNMSKEEIASALHRCIDAQVGAYQLGMSIQRIDFAKLNQKKGDTTVNLTFNTNKNSTEYRKCYYEIERYLMDNCPFVKSKMAANDLENYYSVSKNPEARKLYAKGIDESNSGDLDKAINLFQKALKVDSLFAFAWDNIGLCYRKLNKYDEAIYAYNRSLILDPFGQMPLQNLAVAYRYKKDYPNAIATYERLAEIDFNNPEVYYGIGSIYALELNESVKGLENLCKAYNLYLKQHSPYRSDAEKLINYVFTEMKKNGKVNEFNEILKKNNITPNFE